VLIKGKDGEDGKIHINVVRDGQAVERYTNRYYLEVKGFDVVDENEDGINEPGEWLYVKNIEIQNRGRLFLLEEKYLAITNPFIGQMSTPKTSSVTVMVRETEWLQPDSQEVLHIPPDVQPGQTVTLPGSLRASIKNESEPRKPGNLYVKHEIGLMAYFERTSTPIPEFYGGQPIIYSYPLAIEDLFYSGCITEGQVARFSWTVRLSL
jgi:hypothetical protein